MNGCERELAAIGHHVADRIPTDAIAVENQAAIATCLAIDESDVIARLGIDGRVVSAPCNGELRHTAEGLALDEWGLAVTEGWWNASSTKPLASAETSAEIERYPWPNPADYDYPTAARSAESLREYAVRGPYWKPLFWQVCDLMGYEQALLQLMTAPAVFEAALERVLEHTLEYCRNLLAACGDAMPILCLGDDFATQRGLLMAPALWRRHLKPRYARLFALGKQMGKFVWFHSCGDITTVLPDLIDIGLDVWETVQLHALPVSAAELKRDYGRHITFFGGINTQRLPFASPDDVQREVVGVIEALGEGGGYICGPDHHVKPDVPPANTLALFDTATRFRRTGFTA